MKRDILGYLRKWKDDSKHKPLILRGARQVGKSWLARELGKEFDHFLEVNFEKSPGLCSFFADDINPQRIAANLANYFGKRMVPGKTLLFLDEIQVCPRAILSLRYFFEEFPQLHVISAGSLLEFELRKISFPVGRVNFVYVYPMSFAEYLDAAGKNHLRRLLLDSKLEPLPGPIHGQLIDEIRDYTLIGGMPEVVTDFLANRDIMKCKDIQTALLETFRTDINKYARQHQVQYVQKVFDAVPLHLGQKFKYVNVSRDIKSRELSSALDMLEMAGIIYKVHHSSANGVPLRAEMDTKKFKVIFFDVGLAQSLLKVDHRPLLLKPDISQIKSGAVAELLAGLEILAYKNFLERPELFYWHREAKSSNAEVDYVTSLAGKVVPIEVKSNSSGSMKSLQLFMNKKRILQGIKISGYEFSLNDSIRTVPFYGIESFIRSHSF